MDDGVATIVDELRQSRKYRHLSAETLERIARWASVRYKPAEATKAAKRKLHQVFAAYLENGAAEKLERAVTTLPEDTKDESFRDACRSILKQHTSTAERLEFLEELYSSLWSRVGTPTSIIDIACGFHPFTLPWMQLPDGARYEAWDIDCRLVSQIDRFLPRRNVVPAAHCKDILLAAPEGSFDVALLLKSLPCLEQQEKKSSAPVLKSIRARHIIVSFPLESIGGRQKGMSDHYARFMVEVMKEVPFSAEVFELPNEVFYILETGT